MTFSGSNIIPVGGFLTKLLTTLKETFGERRNPGLGVYLCKLEIKGAIK
jgi:hypothetical protein